MAKFQASSILSGRVRLRMKPLTRPRGFSINTNEKAPPRKVTQILPPPEGEAIYDGGGSWL